MRDQSLFIRFAGHCALFQLGHFAAGVFSSVFLIKQGLSPSVAFLTTAAVLALRFMLRPLTLALAPILGLRRTMIFGAALLALQYPALAQVESIGPELALYVLLVALGGVFYWTIYHCMFAALGKAPTFGRQVASVQALVSLSAMAGPVLGGFAFGYLGPWAGFGVGCAATALSIVPLLSLPDVPAQRVAPLEAFAYARPAAWVFATDGWLFCSAASAWTLIVFQALGSRYENLGSTLAAAAFAGALAGYLFGRRIDLGDGRRVVAFNAISVLGVLLAQTLVGFDPEGVVAIAIAGAALSGVSAPTLMTSFYRRAQAAPCLLRYQFVAEGGWDAGGAASALLAAAVLAAGAPLQAVILCAIPAVLVQAILLHKSYGAKKTP